MSQFEFRVVPSPRRTKRVKGAKTTPDRFAHNLTELLNNEARNGWEFVRAETLPVEAKAGIFSSVKESYESVLVFRRSVGGVAQQPYAGQYQQQPYPLQQQNYAPPPVQTQPQYSQPQMPSGPGPMIGPATKNE